MDSKNTFLGNFNLDIQVQPDGKFDLYVAEEGSSGVHHSNLKLEDIGRIVVDVVRPYVEAQEQDNSLQVEESQIF